MKSGCKVEDRQLGHGQRLQACLAIDMVVAWRIHHMTKLGREVPDLPADVYFDHDECQVLIAYEAKYRKRPAGAPALSLREAIRMVAKLGGFIGRKSDGEPGTETLWRGLLCLDGMTMGWRLAIGDWQVALERGRTPERSRQSPRQLQPQPRQFAAPGD